MAYFKYTSLAAAALLLTACGYSTADRAASGAAIGGGTAAVVGGDVVAGAAVGAAVGAITDPNDINLGKPVWR